MLGTYLLRLAPAVLCFLIACTTSRALELERDSTWRSAYLFPGLKLVRDRRYVEAEKYLVAAVQSAKAEGLPAETYELSLSYLADLYLDLGKYRAAESLLKELIERKKQAKQGTSVMDRYIEKLATLNRSLGQYFEAERLYEEALAMRAHGLNSCRDSRLSQLLGNVGELYRLMERYDEAEKAIADALEMIEQDPLRGELSTTTILYSGRLKFAQGKFREAEATSRRALGMARNIKFIGPNHPRVAEALGDLAEIYAGQEWNIEAEALHKKAIGIWERAVGLEHPSVGFELVRLARVYAAQDRLGEAEALYRRAISIQEKTFGPEHRFLIATLEGLASVLQKLNRGKELAAVKTRLDAARRAQ